MSAPVGAVLLLLDAAAAVGLAEQDTLSRRRISGGGGGEQAKPVDPQHTSCRLIFCNSRQLARLRFALLPFPAISDL